MRWRSRRSVAQTITTDSEGITAGPVSIPVSDGQIPAYRAQPVGKTGLPTILVVQEIFGVHEHIKDLCRRLAKAGYLAIAPALYARQGDPANVASIPVLVDTIVNKVPDDEVMSDLDSTVTLGCSQQRKHQQTRDHGILLGRAARPGSIARTVRWSNAVLPGTDH